jgi:hypothetical protein
MKTSLPKEDEQAIMEQLERLMIQRDYQRRGGTWYLFNPELLHILDFQAGTYRRKAYFNLAVMVRNLDDSTRPRIHDCSVYGRLDRLVPDAEQYELATNFGEAGMAQAERVAYIVTVVQSIVLPFHADLKTVEDVRRFISSPKAIGFTVRESAKHFLQQI